MEVHRPNRHLQASGDVGDEAVVYRKKLLFQRLALLRTTTLSGKLDKYSRLEGKNIPLQTDLNLRAKNKRLPQDQTLNFAHTLALESQGITNS